MMNEGIHSKFRTVLSEDKYKELPIKQMPTGIPMKEFTITQLWQDNCSNSGIKARKYSNSQNSTIYNLNKRKHKSIGYLISLMQDGTCEEIWNIIKIYMK